MSVTEVVVARQAIFDSEHEIVGYELLFRPLPTAQTAGIATDGDVMTTTVLFSSMSIGVSRLVGDKLAFCNGDRGLLTGQVPMTLPPDKTVIEVIETVDLDQQVLDGCRALVAAGYRLALDDFVYHPAADPLLDIASIVKIDLRRLSWDDVLATAARCRARGMLLLAEKIETEDELQACIDAGFDLFQGYVLERPRTVPGRALQPSGVNRIRIASLLMSSDFEVDELEDILRTEPGISLHVLQLAAFGSRDGTRRTVRTLREALLLVGHRRIQNLLALMMLVQPGHNEENDVTAALVRARMCELLADRLGPQLGPFAFTVGLLSALDLLLGVTADELDRSVDLPPELREAAFDHRGRVGSLVADAIAYQAGRLGAVTRSGIRASDFDWAAMNALLWALETSREVVAA